MKRFGTFVTLDKLYDVQYWTPVGIAIVVVVLLIVVLLIILWIRHLIYEDRHGRGVRDWIRRKQMMQEIYEERERRAYENEMWRREQERKKKEEARKQRSEKDADSRKL